MCRWTVIWANFNTTIHRRVFTMGREHEVNWSNPCTGCSNHTGRVPDQMEPNCDWLNAAQHQDSTSTLRRHSNFSLVYISAVTLRSFWYCHSTGWMGHAFIILYILLHVCPAAQKNNSDFTESVHEVVDPEILKSTDSISMLTCLTMRSEGSLRWI